MSATAETPTRVEQDLERELERAASDYLYISRNHHIYSPADYARAEDAAWQRWARAVEAARGVVVDADPDRGER